MGSRGIFYVGYGESWQGIAGELFVAGPADEVAERGLLSVHEYADTVDLCRYVNAGEECSEEQHERHDYLPCRNAGGYACHHYHR